MDCNSIINFFLLKLLRINYRLWRKLNPVTCNPRLWANDELLKFSHLFYGDVVNVSAGKDNDKSGKDYRDYFQNANSYTITNYFPEFTGRYDYSEIELDLSEKIDEDLLKKRFDVVLNFTVLEHIYNVKEAVENLSKMSKDIILTVVPFIQELHQIPSQYKDYWRISPYSLSQLFEYNGFRTIYISWNSDPLGNIYIFHIASCKPENWKDIISPVYLLHGPGAERALIKSGTFTSLDRMNIDYDLIYKSG